jgi:uncharacterized membrane protein
MNLDLRPLSLGEILDRTFSLYRQNFLLFVGISAIPQLLVLPLTLMQTPTEGPFWQQISGQSQAAFPKTSALGLAGLLTLVVMAVVAYVFTQGGTVYAVSELYLGRTTTIGASLRRMRGRFWKLLGVTMLNGLVIGASAMLLIIPGVYMACRLITSVPAALLEDLGPVESISRGFNLTEENAGRAFLIYLLDFFLLYAAIALLTLPFSLLARFSADNPAMAHTWLVASQIGNFLAGVLVAPILLIATAVFYYDLRVRKEGFDLQLMMDHVGGISSGAAATPAALS